MTSRVVTSWIAPLGTSVFSRAAEMTFEIAINDSVDSFPPMTELAKSLIEKHDAHPLESQHCLI